MPELGLVSLEGEEPEEEEAPTTGKAQYKIAE